jgi:hypothetical protein
MLATTDTVLEMEDVSMAKVRCSHCGEQLGRLQLVAPEGEDARAWEEKVQGELDLLADEHESLCPSRNDATS